MTAIALILAFTALLALFSMAVVGLVAGCGVTVALLFALKKPAEAAGLRPRAPMPVPDEQNAARDKGVPLEKQWENLLNYNGRRQTDEEVVDDEDQD